jgi:hypothetical protein
MGIHVLAHGTKLMIRIQNEVVAFAGFHADACFTRLLWKMSIRVLAHGTKLMIRILNEAEKVYL